MSKLISKKTLFNIHGWLGINLGMLLFVICFSGTIATLSNEIDWLLDSSLRIEPKDAPYDWEAMYQNVKAAFPDSRITSVGEQKNPFTEVGDYFAATVFIRTPQGQTRKVHVNPYSGEILAHNSFFDIQRFFRNYHSFFFDQKLGGTLIVTFFSFFLLLSSLTGFLFYTAWLKNLFQLRWKKGLKVFFTDAHRQFGIWALLFTLIIAITGTFYFVEDILGITGKFKVLVPDPLEKITQAEISSFGDNLEFLSLNTYAKNAVQAFPELRVEQIRIPSKLTDHVYVDGQDGNPFTRDRANKVYLNPFSGEVVKIQKAADLNTIELVTDIVDPSHFGTFGGLTVKIIWFFFGLILSFSILTGTYIWYKKRTHRLITKSERIKFHNPKNGWNKVSVIFKNTPKTIKGAFLSTILTLLYLTITGANIVTDGIKSLGPFPVERLQTIQKDTLGPWKFSLLCEYPCTLKQGTKFHLDFGNSGLPNYASLNLSVISKNDSVLKIPFKGPAAKPLTTLPSKVDSLEDVTMNIEITTNSKYTLTTLVNLRNLKEVTADMAKRFTTEPERAYPEVPKAIYIFILAFFLITLFILLIWTYYIAKVTSLKYLLALKSP